MPPMSKATHHNQAQALARSFVAGWAKGNAERERGIALMLGGQHRLGEVAELVGVSRWTMRRWWRKFEKDFRAAGGTLSKEVE